MGGNAFADLSCPRLPHDVYYEVRDRCRKVLEEFYEKVTSAPEAPDKPDHGDVDFLVAESRAHDLPTEHLAAALGAVDFKRNDKTTNFALEHPERNGEYIQVDVHLCPSTHFHWEVFQQSYGDLMQIIGVLNRPIGLTAKDKGFHFRIAEIEEKNKKKAMVFLTSDPDKMMRFLSLDVDQYHKGFATNEEIFEWCFEGELFAPPKTKEETVNDRNRHKKREMFTKCLREWYPAHRDEIFHPERRIWTREEILQEALRSFPDSQPIYEAAMTEHNREAFEIDILAAMREVGTKLHAKPKVTKEVIRGSKRFLDYVDGEWVLSSVPLGSDAGTFPVWLQHIQTVEDKSRFISWLEEHFEELHGIERARMKDEEQVKEAAKLEKALASISHDDED